MNMARFCNRVPGAPEVGSSKPIRKRLTSVLPMKLLTRLSKKPTEK